MGNKSKKRQRMPRGTKKVGRVGFICLSIIIALFGLFFAFGLAIR